MNPQTSPVILKEKLRSLIEDKVYDKDSMKKMNIPDQSDNWWIFNFKSFLFEKDTAKMISDLFWHEMQSGLLLSKSVAVGGMESGAISLVSAICLNAPEGINVSGFFIRKSRKKSDLANDIEGFIPKDATIIIVDDILNRSSSYQKIKKVLESYNKKVSGYFSIVRYRDKSFYENKDLGAPILSLYELNDFEKTLGVKNLKTEPYKPVFTYENKWAIQLCKPNPYYVVPKSAPLLHKGLIYLGVDDGTFFAIDADVGKIVWSYKISFGAEGKRIFSSPVIYEDCVIFGAYDGNLYALDLLTGKKKWVFFDGDAIGSSPAVVEDLGILYIGLEFGLFKKKGGIAAINAKTGKSIWTYYEMDGLTHASPAYSKKLKVVVCGCNNKKIYCFDAKSGNLKWTVETKGEVKYSATFDELRGMVYVGSIDGNVYGIKVATGEIIIKFSTSAGIYSNPLIYKDTLMVGSLDRNIYCWNINTGDKIWTHSTSGRIFATGLIDEDRLYIGSNDGRLRVIELSNGKLLGDILLPERIVNKVQIDNEGTIFIPTHTCQLLAFKEIKN